MTLTSKDWFNFIFIEPVDGEGKVRIIINDMAEVDITLTAAAAEDMGTILKMRGMQSRL